ncbi:unnamed protein product [Brassica rapa]|uniref:Uncharacterized protein n=1 Tax=Brassica campestris TaxID=3711 RepID=A0A8D9DFI9_BRACM|nr:unnamed protein product [Brassica rapa]
MARLVRVFKGQWFKSQDGVWRFDQDPTMTGRDILIANTEHLETLKDLVRAVFCLRTETPMVVTFQLPQWMLEPDGGTWPPHNLNSNADVDMMMSVHDWNVEPRLCVIFGAQDVATYQFRCRRPFTIGSSTFLAQGVTEEQHMARVLDMIRGNELLCSEQVLNEIFDEEKMVLLYRFSLEIQKAKNSLDLNLGPMVETDDHIVPNIGGEGGTHVQHGGGVPNTEVQPDVARGELPTGDVPFNTPPHFAASMTTTPRQSMYGPHYYTPHMGSMAVRGSYWENLMSSRYAVDVQRIYGVPGSEYVGYSPNDLNIGNPTGPPMLGSPNGPPMHGYGVPIEVSSTASSTEVHNVRDIGVTVNTSKETGIRDGICVEKGESSNRPEPATHADLDVNFQIGDTTPAADVGVDAGEGRDA